MSFEEIDKALDLITVNWAKTMHLSNEYGLEVGKPASFLILEADSAFEAIRQRADVIRSVRNGRELFVKQIAPVKTEIDLLK